MNLLKIFLLILFVNACDEGAKRFPLSSSIESMMAGDNGPNPNNPFQPELCEWLWDTAAGFGMGIIQPSDPPIDTQQQFGVRGSVWNPIVFTHIAGDIFLMQLPEIRPSEGALSHMIAFRYDNTLRISYARNCSEALYHTIPGGAVVLNPGIQAELIIARRISVAVQESCNVREQEGEIESDGEPSSEQDGEIKGHSKDHKTTQCCVLQ